MTGRPPFRPDLILEVLVRHGVEFVLIGGTAAAAHGSHVAHDIDVCHKVERNDLERLAAALFDLDAKIRLLPDQASASFDRSAPRRPLDARRTVSLRPRCGPCRSASSGAGRAPGDATVVARRPVAYR